MNFKIRTRHHIFLGR